MKATLLRGLFPAILTPDFSGGLDERMQKLTTILDQPVGPVGLRFTRWTIIGSSFGGLMGALYACRHPQQVVRLILLAPALIWPDFAAQPPAPVAVPTVIYHGIRDEIVPLEPVRRLAQQVFQKLEFHEVDDDHGLYATVHRLEWEKVIAS